MNQGKTEQQERARWCAAKWSESSTLEETEKLHLALLDTSFEKFWVGTAKVNAGDRKNKLGPVRELLHSTRTAFASRLD